MMKTEQDLLQLIRSSIQEELVADYVCNINAYKQFNVKQGVFVTLRIHGKLRGCIGAILVDKPLYVTVYEMAKKAAFSDHRFSPLTLEEFQEVRLSLSVLSDTNAVRSADDIVIGTHGIILYFEGRSSVFLPEVATEQGWTKEECLEQLSLKAGCEANTWKRARFEVFTSRYYQEKTYM